jgi:hypothetical protein
MIDYRAAGLVAQIIAAFVAEYRQSSSIDASQTRLYEVLREACYALAFVTPDGNNARVPLKELLRDPAPIADYDFVELRRLIHTLWRAEHWNYQCIESGVNPVSEAVRSGTLQAISHRLGDLVEAASAAADNGA